MKVTLFGTGYVALVTGACLAEMGNHVVCVDMAKANKVWRLKSGAISNVEAESAAIINHERGQLDFTGDMAPSIAHARASFAVSSPSDEDGRVDVRRYVPEPLRTLYARFNRNRDGMIVTDGRSAELTKSVTRAMRATKTSVMNEIAHIAKRIGAGVLATMTQWKAFRSPDFAWIKSALAGATIFDGRHPYEPTTAEEAGLAYDGMDHGRALQR